MSRIDLINTFGNEDAKTFNKCSKAYEKGRADAIDEVIKTLAESEDTILSDRQYYEILKLKGGANNES